MISPAASASRIELEQGEVKNIVNVGLMYIVSGFIP